MFDLTGQAARVSWLRIAAAALALHSMSSVVHAEGSGGAETIRFASASPTGKRVELVGHLRRPAGPGAFPAVVLLHGCGGDFGADARWGARLAEWGYVALSVDSFGPRGIENVCKGGAPADHVFDPYGALEYLAAQPFVTPDRVAVMGLSLGGRVSLFGVEQGFVEAMFQRKFRAAIALYPDCSGVSGAMTVPTLILIGERDDWASPRACEDLAAGHPSRTTRSGPPDGNIRLVLLPGAYHDFDNPLWQPGLRYLDHRLEYSEDATQRSVEEIRRFLHARLGGKG